MSFARVALAFVRKDYLEEVSYRFNFLFGVAGILITLMFLAAVSDFVGDAIATKLKQYDGNYLAFLVLGLGLYSLLDTALRDLSRRIRVAQTLGTLEALLATRTRLPALVLCLPLYPFLKTTLRLAGYLVLGLLIFSLPIRWGNWPAALLLFALTVAAFGCVGLAFAALTVVFKRTEPVIAVFGTASALVGGVFYPLDVLPTWLQKLAHLLPITPALQGIRLSLLSEATWQSLWPPILNLTAFTAVLLPTSILLFRWAIRRAMRDGSLTQY